MIRITCQQWSPPYTCALGLHGGKPSPGKCRKCSSYQATDGATERIIHVPDPGSQPVPRDQWPAWANEVATHAQPGEIGVGDTVKRMTGKFGDGFTWLTEKVGINCGCKDRHATWNVRYPYETPPQA